MKKTTNKWLASLVVVGLLLSLLGGCQTPTGDDTVTTSSTATATSTTSSTAATTTENTTDSTTTSTDNTTESTVTEPSSTTAPSSSSTEKTTTTTKTTVSATTVTEPTSTTASASATTSTTATTKENTTQVTTTTRTVADMSKTYSILFIGNSYTYYSSMPTAIFKPFAESAGYTVEVTAITAGGYRLSQFANPSDTYGAQVDKALTGGKTYDYVVLQEQSTLPATVDADEFYAAARDLVARIRKADAQPILYATWGRHPDSAELNNYGWTNESMTWKLAAAYQAIGKELNVPVAYAGLAFYDLVSKESDIELYDSDKTHPSYEGSYLAAATLFAEIFRVDPTTVAYKPVTMSLTDVSSLRRAAKKAVFQTPSIPVQYKTTTR